MFSNKKRRIKSALFFLFYQNLRSNIINISGTHDDDDAVFLTRFFDDRIDCLFEILLGGVSCLLRLSVLLRNNIQILNESFGIHLAFLLIASGRIVNIKE